MSFFVNITFEVFVSIALVIVAYVIYGYLPMHYTYWKKLGIKYAQPRLLPQIYYFFRTPIHDIDRYNYEEHGRIHGQYEGTQPVLYLSEPELIKQMLVKDFGSFMNQRDITFNNPLVDNMLFFLRDDKWKRVRTILTPAFTTGKIKRMTKVIKESSQTLSEYILKHNEGEPVDIRRCFQMFTMDVIAQTAFATKMDFFNGEGDDFFTHGRNLFSLKKNWRTIVAITMPKVASYFKLSFLDNASTDFFIGIVNAITKERLDSKKVHNDFLQLMVDAAKDFENKGEQAVNGTTDHLEQTEESSMFDIENSTEDNQKTLKPSSQYKTLTHDEMVAQCASFLAVGFDTTASTLGFACYFLALNPECQDRLFEEVDSVLKANNGDISYDAVQSMKYLDKVLAETLRLYPAVVRIERSANEDYDFGAHNLNIKKGTLIAVPVFAMHRDPEFFPDPEKFDPERFDSKEKDNRHPYAYLPFGAGPRICLGMRFAMMEMKLCLATVISKIQFTRVPETKIPLEFKVGQNLLCPKDLTLGVKRRT